VTFASVRKIGLGIDGVVESTCYGAPALEYRGRIFVCMASHKSAEPNTLVAIVGDDARDELIAADGSVYYVKDHYLGYGSVLVRLQKIKADELSGLVKMAHAVAAAKGPRKSRRSQRAKPGARERR
jgi:hypothetical protein